MDNSARSSFMGVSMHHANLMMLFAQISLASMQVFVELVQSLPQDLYVHDKLTGCTYDYMKTYSLCLLLTSVHTDAIISLN